MGIILQFVAKVTDVDVDDPRGVQHIVPPDPSDQLITTENLIVVVN